MFCPPLRELSQHPAHRGAEHMPVGRTALLLSSSLNPPIPESHPLPPDLLVHAVSLAPSASHYLSLLAHHGSLCKGILSPFGFSSFPMASLDCYHHRICGERKKKVWSLVSGEPEEISVGMDAFGNTSQDFTFKGQKLNCSLVDSELNQATPSLNESSVFRKM